MPGRSLSGRCPISETRLRRSRGRSAHFSHGTPEFGCTCGIYASKNLDHLRSTRYWQYGSVHGEIWLWGSVVEHQHGYRAQFAYPKKLFLKSEDLPISLAEIEMRHEDRTHLGLEKGTPNGRNRDIASGRVLSRERLGGLHHRYDRAA